jgi:hypothetical protein
MDQFSFCMFLNCAPKIDHHVPLVAQPPTEKCEVCVIVPARDESARIEKCLLALVNQVGLSGDRLSPERYEVIVLANNCRDDTAALARTVARRHPRFALHVVEIQFSPEKSFVGSARKLLMDEACRRLFLLGRPSGIIASTDGDTFVEPTWVAGILREIAAGADAVGGRIIADPNERALLSPSAQGVYLRQVAYDYLLAELEHLIDPDPFDRFPRHANHIGASLAVTAATYARVGGLPNVLEEEDKELYKAIVRGGARFRHSLRVRATTSARLDGRVERGFATGLKMFSNLEKNSSCLWVENVFASETRLRARRVVRELNQMIHLRPALTISEVQAVARLLRVSPAWLLREIQRSQPWGQLVERIELCQASEGQWERSWPKMLLSEGVTLLRSRLSDLRRPPEKEGSPRESSLHSRPARID